MQQATESNTFNVPLAESLTPENEEYLKAHPELKTLLSDFLSSVISKKPEDVKVYAKEYFTTKDQGEAIFKPIVLSGPSGVGKGTLIKMLLERFPGVFELSVSYTTRKPRQGEQHGVQYFFVTPEEFSSEIASDSFIEYTEVHGNFYGTHRGYVKRVMENKKLCLLEIDVVGAQKVFKSGQDCHYVFLNPPSIDELKRRLNERGTEKPEVINLRMTNAVVEMEMAKNFGIYQKFITNNILEETFTELVNYLNSIYPGLNLKI